MVPTLFTRRTVLEPLSLADAPQIQAIFDDWEVVKYLTARVPWPYPPDGAATYLREQALPAMESGNAWHWSIRLRSNPAQIIGCAGLIDGEESNRGFWLGREWHRYGLMSEVADAITDYWFETLGRHVLRVYKAIANAGSRRISERSGMRVVAAAERDFVCGRLPAEYWEITAMKWREYRSSRAHY
jgi:[ribosomal protein S5]-alanine N-acetyltransferase